jgi:hypothetical protein
MISIFKGFEPNPFLLGMKEINHNVAPFSLIDVIISYTYLAPLSYNWGQAKGKIDSQLGICIGMHAFGIK